jgi:adenine-specific DNA-methyltransferase
MSFVNAFKIVSELVNDFKENENHYLNSSYSEADIRNDFINKFFIALGWDVRHETQKNPYEQEVRVEKAVQIAKAQKRADYSFSIAPNYRTVKFFVEAKKPAHALENKDYYFQTARYGWNASTPIALLTDFEEFHIIDCRFRPDINDALNYKIKQFHYSDYTDKEKFSEIYWLFSREAVIDNSIEKYVDALPKPRGKKAKGLKAAVQSIDESFLEELDEIRNDLAKSFKKNNTHLSSEELTEATQRTIDRLVFIKFLEDKLIEPEHYVSEFGGKRKAWEDFLIDSRKLDAKYNGVVFKKSIIDSKSTIEPDDKTFSDICNELSHENTPYNFDAIPIHILGSIYERFLGKVVNATDKRVTIEEKPEVRKAGGVYYTPQYIVNYIVDNTVGKLIDGKTPKEIAKMRFTDIACGSGSFLITVFERLLDYHKRWYIENPEQAKKDGCILVEGVYHLSLKQKTKILLNNVYGVDIDPQAVEVTQLSLYLKLLEDETTATANDSWVMFKEQLLPDLNKNIVCGNSLIGTDILDLTLFPSPYQGEGQRERFDELKLKPMDFETVFPHIFPAKAGGPVRRSPKDEGGFDAIVGNPPYGFRQIHSKESKEYFKKRFSTVSGSFDNYFLFYECSLRLLKHNGLHGFIVPVTWLTIPSAKELRKFVLEKFGIVEIDWLPERVFKEAQVNTVISIIKNSNEENVLVKIYRDRDEFGKPTQVYNLNKKTFIDNDYFIGIFSNPVDETILNKVKKKTVELGKITKPCSGYNPYEVGKGIAPNGKPHTKETVLTKPYHSTTKINSEWKEEIIGRNLDRYSISNIGERWIRYGSWLAAARDHTNFLGKRVLVQEITGGNDKRLVAAFYDGELYHSRDIIPVKIINEIPHHYYLLGIINSKLISWYHQKKNPKAKKSLFPKILVSDLSKLPIKEIDLKNEIEKKLYDDVVRFVDQILTAKKQLQQAKTESDKNYLERKCATLDNQIDEIVYQLYGLAEEEIKIVEGNEKSFD